MPDFYDAASQQNDATKTALLAAIAQHGSQATAAMQQATQAIQAQRSQALAAALAESSQRGAPQAVTDQNAATIGSGYDRQLADLSSASASRQASNQSQQAQAGTYFDEAKAALPALRTRSNMQSATIAQDLANRLASAKSQQDLAAQSGNRQAAMFEAQLKDRHDQGIAAEDARKQAAQDKADQQAIQLQIAQINAGKAQAGADTAAAKAAKPAKPPTVPQLLANSVGDKATFNSYVDQQKAAQPKIGQLSSLGAILSSAQAEATGRQIGLPAGVGNAIYAEHQKAVAAADKTQAAKAAQTAAGLKMADQSAKFDPVKIGGKTGIPAGTIRTIHASQEYAAAETSVTANVGMKNRDGTNYTRAQLLSDLTTHFGKSPAVVKVLMAEYGDLFPTKA